MVTMRDIADSAALTQVNAFGVQKPYASIMRKGTFWFAFVLLGLSTSAAFADAGLPMIFVSMPGMVCAIVPIVFIEAAILARSLSIPGDRAFEASVLANLASTFAGIPLAWLIMVLLSAVTGGGGGGFDTTFDKVMSVTRDSAWFFPYREWQIPTAQLVLLFPFFLASWWIETRILWRNLGHDFTRVRYACLRANLVSYGLLMAVTICAIVWTITPAVSRHEADTLGAQHADEIESLQKALSVLLATAVTTLTDDNSVFWLDELAVQEIKSLVDCRSYLRLTVGAEAIQADSRVLPIKSDICLDRIGLLDMSGKPARQTDYGWISVGAAGDPAQRHFVFQFERDFGGIRYAVEAIFDTPRVAQ